MMSTQKVRTLLEVPSLPLPPINKTRSGGADGKISANSFNTPPSAAFHTRPILKRLGSWAIFALAGGLIGIIGASAFLIFLWVSDESNTIWQTIILSGWATRAVTLASFVIRAAVSFQAGVCTAMLAAIALERGEVALAKAAEVSGMRFATVNPHEIALSLVASQQKPGVALTLSLFLIGTTSLLQFASTILLSDFRGHTILGEYNEGTIKYRRRGNLGSKTYLDSRPPVYPLFAEYRTENNSSERLNSDESRPFYGTGLTYRAFFPFADPQTRNALSYYKGKATVYDASVTCVRPKASFDLTRGRSGYGTLRLNGTIEPQVAVPLGSPDSAWPQDFLALAAISEIGGPFSGDFQDPLSDWAVTVSQLDPSSAFGLRSTLTANPTAAGSVYLVANTSGHGWGKVAFPNTTGDDWLAGNELNISVSDAIFDTSPNVSDILVRVADSQIEPDGEWAHYIYKGNISGVDLDGKLSLSLCYTSLAQIYGHVVAKSGRNRTEPSLGYDTENGNGYITSSIRQQLQLGSESDDQKLRNGYMELIPGNNTWHDSRDGSRISILDGGLYGWSDNASYLFCSSCGTSFYSATKYNPYGPEDTSFNLQEVHTAHIALFQDTLKATGHPAIALQSLTTTLVSYAYYDQLLSFTEPAPVGYILYTTALAPGSSSRGLQIVLVLLATHLLLVAVIVVIFGRSSKWSMLGNAWQTVSQTLTLATPRMALPGQGRGVGSSHVLEMLFERSRLATDDEVQEVLKLSGWSNLVVRLEPNDAARRVAFELRERRAHRHKT